MIPEGPFMPSIQASMLAALVFLPPISFVAAEETVCSADGTSTAEDRRDTLRETKPGPWRVLSDDPSDAVCN